MKGGNFILSESPIFYLQPAMACYEKRLPIQFLENRSTSQVLARVIFIFDPVGIKLLFFDFLFLFVYSDCYSHLHNDVVVNRKINCLVCNIFRY